MQTPSQNAPRLFQSAADWRATIPWTNEEIALALREAGANEPRDFLRQRHERAAVRLLETGRLCSAVLALALPVLVRVCRMCGKKALYRWGHEGRCSAHRDLRPQYIRERVTRLEDRQSDREQTSRTVDRLRRAHEEYQRLEASRRRRRK